MKMVKALGDRYERVSGSEAVRLINSVLKERGCPLTESQERWLKYDFGNSGIIGDLDMPFQVLKWKEETVKGKNPLWRLTIPILFIWFVVFYWVICPVKWLFTGKMSFSHKSWIATFNTNWYHEVFD
jgi:hypothetical protein